MHYMCYVCCLGTNVILLNGGFIKAYGYISMSAYLLATYIQGGDVWWLF